MYSYLRLCLIGVQMCIQIHHSLFVICRILSFSERGHKQYMPIAAHQSGFQVNVFHQQPMSLTIFWLVARSMIEPLLEQLFIDPVEPFLIPRLPMSLVLVRSIRLGVSSHRSTLAAPWRLFSRLRNSVNQQL